MLSVVLVLSAVLLYQYHAGVTSLREASTATMSEDLLDQMMARGASITRLLAETLRNPMYHYDLAAIEELLKAVKSQNNVSEAYAYDEMGKIIQDGTGYVKKYGIPLDDLQTIEAIRFQGRLVTSIDGDLLSISLPIWIGEQPLGGVKVVLSLDSGLRHIQSISENMSRIVSQKQRKDLYVILAIVLLSLVVVVFVVNATARRLTRPIKELSESAAAIGRGNYSLSLMPPPNNEIGDLIIAFDQMKRDLAESTISLDLLEKEVARRTREISSANEKLQLENSQRLEAEDTLRQYQGRKVNKYFF